MAKIRAKDLSVGDIIEFNNSFWKVLEIKHSHLGRGGANLQMKIKNLVNNSNLIKNFNPAEEVILVEIEERPLRFIYSKQDLYYFMDDQKRKVFLNKETLGNKINFLKSDLNITGLFEEDKLINIVLPIKANFKVIEAPPGIKGDSQKNNFKTVTLETGYQLMVPLFIKEGDEIIVNTETGEYVERAK
jgi:elongation factor P